MRWFSKEEMLLDNDIHESVKMVRQIPDFLRMVLLDGQEYSDNNTDKNIADEKPNHKI